MGRPTGSLNTAPRVSPTTPILVCIEGCAEALAAIDNDATALDERARILETLAAQDRARATRLRKVVRPYLERGYDAAEQFADFERRRQLRAARGRRVVVASVIAGRIAA